MSKIRLSLYIAFLVSVLTHLILFNFALNARWMRRMFAEAPGRDFFKVEEVTSRTYERVVPDADVTIDDLLSFTRDERKEFDQEKSKEDREKLIEEKEFIPFDASEDEIYDSIKKMFEGEEVERRDDLAATEDPGESIAQEILAIEAGMLGDKIEPGSWVIGSEVTRGDATADFVFLDESPTGVYGVRGTGKGVPVGVGDEAREEFLLDDSRISTIIKPPEDVRVTEIEMSEIEDTLVEDVSEIRKYSPLDDLLQVSLYTYHEPDDPVGFFEVVIKPRADRREFARIPKDIVFIVDSSSSIVQPKLDEYIGGLVHAVGGLGEEDRFTIVEFKDYIRAFSDGLVQATPLNRSLGQNFLKKLESSGETDVYQAFAPLVKERPSPERPYVLFLVTDGRPTSGIVENRRIINEITKVNQNEAAIYSFAGGSRINEYLLDLLSYRNKGVSRFEKKLSRIREVLSAFADEIQHPILMNLEYSFASLSAEEIYPKVLPDFYLASKIVITGRYRGEGTFSMQLLGTSNGETKEYIFQQDLTEEDTGSRNVARMWAFQKIYYLIGRMVEEGQTTGMLSEIESLSRRFELQTPYF